MVFIRADSNPIIAGGHIMRCIAIANELKSVGVNVHFLIADENSIQPLEINGIAYTVLGTNWQDLNAEIEQVKNILRYENNPVLLIDTYMVQRTYIEQLRPYCKIGYLGSKKEYLGNLDFLINYSADMDYDFYNKYYKSTKLLLGASYVPLRDEFKNINHRYKNKIEHILITTGNTNKDNMIESIMGEIMPVIEENKIFVDVVLGRMFNDKQKFYDDYSFSPYVEIFENVNSMSELMNKCDLAITANGTTVYELAAVGVPMMSFAMVDEQTKNAKALEKLGVVDYCGCSYMNKMRCVENIKKRLEYFIGHNDELIRMARQAHRLVDGSGCKKIISALLGA
ncbi:UDP-2,4-diacetamido-2,4,6-trideoxy-beta-L-altropyranose hydrolase [Selenomonas ruminantium]|uniref:UDP-2,4-diacetamido-2,4,6-trideoxy-beta-L-altropyranose hydrolase n=1 Tax=Selenomonas ruminantium TaxID=971 RepID=A0A1I0XXA6_SELRU|nr:UDP-2,4-diacetamido-2,4,6-trideoxy-beta-L-altropyranose hydrolase [Selenomonas ruminantium]SFB05685.1 UDP-2,4-diacetamido-2,4,6-trideoxy-beta-L-altropyranose hydrolase [Selenomonas ruminantium]